MARNSGLSRSRGCASGTRISAQMRPGFEDRIRIRSHRSTASSILWVTRSTVFSGSVCPTHKSRKSVRSVSAVSTSSAENGPWEKRDEEYDGERQITENRHRLQDIVQRNQHGFRPTAFGGNRCVGQREYQRGNHGQEHPRGGAQGIKRKRRRGERNGRP